MDVVEPGSSGFRVESDPSDLALTDIERFLRFQPTEEMPAFLVSQGYVDALDRTISSAFSHIR